MFRRLQSGLPKDPVFPSDLEGLGYFISGKDEIRSIENPKAYFKFFITKNDRYNCVQREFMNGAIRKIVWDRLESLGLKKVLLPLGAQANEANLPIFISSDLAAKKRIIVLFYEHTQDLAIFAHRIIGGKGGINEGSAVNFVKAIQAQKTSGENNAAPGIVLANMGQLRWWRKGKKAVTQTSWLALPQKSAADEPFRFNSEKNTIPHNKTTAEHVNYIFNTVVEQLAPPDAKLDIVGVSEGAVRVSIFLENQENFKKWGKRVEAFASIGTFLHAQEIKNIDFADWFVNRGRAYTISPEPAGTFIAPHNGRKLVPAYGCPVFSLGEPYYNEALLPKGYKTVLDWFQEVALDPEYENPEFQRFDVGGEDDESEHEQGWKEGDGVNLNGRLEIGEAGTKVNDGNVTEKGTEKDADKGVNENVEPDPVEEFVGDGGGIKGTYRNTDGGGVLVTFAEGFRSKGALAAEEAAAKVEYSDSDYSQ